jgi:hypothetical protein
MFKRILILGICMSSFLIQSSDSQVINERDLVEIGAIYEHYKGKKYKILDVVFNADNCELAVVYESLYDDPQFGSHAHWVRSLKEFVGTQMVNGKELQRFKKVVAE